MKDVIKLICHLPPTSCELSAFKNCVIRNAVGEEKLSKASLADVNFHMEFIAFKLQNISAVTTTCFLPRGFRSFGNWNGQTLCKKFCQNQINTGKM